MRTKLPVTRSLIAHVGGGDRPWVYAVAALAFIERVATVGVVGAVAAAPSARLAIALTAGLGVVALARRAAAASLARRVRAGFLRLGVASVLGGDVLEVVSADDDAGALLFRGLFEAERIIVEVCPLLAADVLASSALLVAGVATIEPRLVALASGALVFALAVALGVRAVTARAIESADEAYRPLVDAMIDSIGGRLEIVANGQDTACRRGFDGAASAWLKVAARSDHLSAATGRLPILVAGAAVAGAVLLDASVRGQLSRGAIHDALMLGAAAPALLGAIRGTTELFKADPRLRALVALLSAPARLPGGARKPDPPQAVEWKRVSFSYAQLADSAPHRAALREIDLRWSPGEVLVVCGENGSGKSTLLKTLLAVARPGGGEITVGGVDLFAHDLEAWRSGLAFLSQRPYLSERATVRRAMSLVCDRADDRAMQRALAAVDAWPALTERAPEAPLDVTLGALSVGQRQRIAVARVLARDARVILLDEPDSNLDAAGVAVLARLVRELARDRMVAIAAHTPAMVEVGDVVVTLAAGRVRDVERRHPARSATPGGPRHAPPPPEE